MTDTRIDDRWAEYGTDAEHTREWQMHGFSVESAAVWNRYKVAPIDAMAWERASFHGGDLPSRAALWHRNGFTPRDALAWGALPGECLSPWGFAPSMALLFRDAGFTPAQAWPWWRRGFTAAVAGKWRDAGLSGAVAEGWINGGFEIPTSPCRGSRCVRHRPRHPCTCGHAQTPVRRSSGGSMGSTTSRFRDGGGRFHLRQCPGWAPGGSSPPTPRTGAPRGLVTSGLRDPLLAVRAVG